MANIITIYFSLKGETIGAFMKVIHLDKGNTQVAAEFIQKAVGGELFEIETVKEYKKDHFQMIEEAKEEKQKGIRVEVKNHPNNIEQYDTVFLGYPNWWNSLPMPVVTFLEQCDWSGKRIIPFCTNQGSGLGNTVKELTEICKGATIEKGISIKGTKVGKSEGKIAKWAEQQLTK